MNTDNAENPGIGPKLWMSVRMPMLSALTLALGVFIAFEAGQAQEAAHPRYAICRWQSVWDKFMGPKRAVKSKSVRFEPVVDGCKHFKDDEAICKADAKPGSTIHNYDVNSCFVSRAEYQSPLDTLVLVGPTECSSFGALGMVSLQDLRQSDKKDRFKKVDKIPPKIAPFYKEVNKGVTPRSLLTFAKIILETNGEAAKDLFEFFGITDYLREPGLSSGQDLNEDQLRMIAHAISFYNATIDMREAEISEQRDKIILKCAGYSDKPVLPLSCHAVNEGDIPL